MQIEKAFFDLNISPVLLNLWTKSGELTGQRKKYDERRKIANRWTWIALIFAVITVLFWNSTATTLTCAMTAVTICSALYMQVGVWKHPYKKIVDEFVSDCMVLDEWLISPAFESRESLRKACQAKMIELCRGVRRYEKNLRVPVSQINSHHITENHQETIDCAENFLLICKSFGLNDGKGLQNFYDLADAEIEEEVDTDQKSVETQGSSWSETPAEIPSTRRGISIES